MDRTHEAGIRGIKGKEEAVRQILATEENIANSLSVYILFMKVRVYAHL